MLLLAAVMACRDGSMVLGTAVDGVQGLMRDEQWMRVSESVVGLMRVLKDQRGFVRVAERRMGLQGAFS